jgi:hypothetical protein
VISASHFPDNNALKSMLSQFEAVWDQVDTQGFGFFDRNEATRSQSVRCIKSGHSG